MFSLEQFTFNGVDLVSTFIRIEQFFFTVWGNISFVFFQDQRADSYSEERGECILVFVLGSLR